MSTRREFLTAAPLREALQHAAEEAAAVPIAGNTIRMGKAAMASDFEVILNPRSPLLAAASDALDEIDRLENQLSVYRPHSELSQLNARAAAGSVVVETRLLSLLEETLQYAEEFDGAYDPTAGPLVALWRICRRERRLPNAGELDAARSRLGYRDVAIDSEQGTIRYLRPDIELNLNAIGKGYALDRAAEVLLAARKPDEGQEGEEADSPARSDPSLPPFERGGGVNGTPAPGFRELSQSCTPRSQGESTGGEGERQSISANDATANEQASGETPNQQTPAPPAFLLHGGYSSILARGALRGLDGWPIALRHPLVPNRTLATIILHDRAMSTSGSAVQFFRVGDRRYGHILDPRTGWPAEGILSVTVLAPTAARAEALSTAFFVAGVEKAREYCHNHMDVAALIVPAPVSGQRLEPVNCGIAETDLLWESDG